MLDNHKVYACNFFPHNNPLRYKSESNMHKKKARVIVMMVKVLVLISDVP